MTNLATEVKALRQAKKWTQGDLAMASGVSITTICCYERQKYIPNVQTLAILLDALGYELAVKKKS